MLGQIVHGICGRWNSDLYEIYARLTRDAAAKVTSLIGSTPFEDLERGFHSEEFELLPGELAVAPEFEDFEFGDDDDEDWTEI